MQHPTQWLRTLMLVIALLASTSSTAANASNQPRVGRADATVHAMAAQLCDTLHGLPARRKQECCNASVTSMASVCTEQVAAALQRHAVHIDEGALAACTKASSTSLKGCDWIGPLQPQLPNACASLIEGNIKADARCQSSLECEDGFYCRGASPLVAGVCAAPAKPGNRCERPADNLASFARAADDPRHPSCDGICLRGQCLAAVAQGGRCHASAVCSTGLTCVENTCQQQPLPTLGTTCTLQTGCANGAICLDQKCALPKAGGATCKLPFECRSLECRKNIGEETGQCVDACQVLRPGAALKLGE